MVFFWEIWHTCAGGETMSTESHNNIHAVICMLFCRHLVVESLLLYDTKLQMCICLLFVDTQKFYATMLLDWQCRDYMGSNYCMIQTFHLFVDLNHSILFCWLPLLLRALLIDWYKCVFYLRSCCWMMCMGDGSSAVKRRTRNRESPGSNPLCYRFEVWAFSFSPLSCINEYLAIDAGGNVSDFVLACNCCLARMLPGEAELV